MSQSHVCGIPAVDTKTDTKCFNTTRKDDDDTPANVFPDNASDSHHLTQDERTQPSNELHIGKECTGESKYTLIGDSSSYSNMADVTESNADLLDESGIASSEETCQASTGSVSKDNSSKKILKRVIILQPDDDADKVTSDVIKQITAMLDDEAAKQIAQGKTPDTETVIEITGIKAQTAKHPTHKRDNDLPVDTSPRLMLPQEQKHHRRKSAHSKHYMYHSPSPMQRKNKAASTLTNADCYFQHQLHHCSSYATASSKLLGRGSAIPKSSCTPSTIPRARRQKPAILRSAHWSVSTGVNVQKKASASSTSVSTCCDEGVHFDGKEQTATATAVSNDGKRFADMLTNIHWLGSLPNDVMNPIKLKDSSHQTVTEEDQKRIPKQRPPFSYMNLILMAISDDSDRRMTLKQIYQWIEEKYPYYKYCASPSWKNSIRQNLSLCDIFINEKSGGRSGRSYWKLNSSLPLVANYIQNSQTRLMHTLHNEQANQTGSKHIRPVSQTSSAVPDNNPPATALIVTKQQNTRKTHNKTPVPLLPKVPQLHVYSSQPVHNVIPVLLQPTVIVSPLSVTADAKTTNTTSTQMSVQLMQQQAGLMNLFNPVSQCLDSVGVCAQVANCSTPKAGLEQPPGCPQNTFRTRPCLESACKLLAKEEVQLEGLRTPPPMSDVLPKSSMKHYCSPTETSGGKQTKHIKVAQEMDVYDHMMRRHFFPNHSTASALASGLVAGRSSPSGSMDSTDLSNLLSQVAFSDSGFVSDCSTIDSAGPKLGSLPEMKLPQKSEFGDDDFLVESNAKTEENSLSDLDLDIVSGMEPSLTMNMSDLLWTPPKANEMDGYLTSTPFREDPSSTPPPINNDSEDEFISLSFGESMMNTSDPSDGLDDSSASLVSAAKTETDTRWENADNYMAEEVINLEIGLSTFD